jgi:Escherichia/Staphylococcus phage prohead protease
MTDTLAMEMRSVSLDERLIVGVAAPYGTVSHLTPHPEGERIMRGAFRRSIAHRGDRIPLCRAHDHTHALGMAREWTDDDNALVGTFHVRQSALGDEALEEARDGYLSGLSVGFLPVAGGVTHGRDGVREVRDARLVEVSLTVIPSYDGAEVLAVRQAQSVGDIMAIFRAKPAVDLSPLPALWAYDRPR